MTTSYEALDSKCLSSGVNLPLGAQPRGVPGTEQEASPGRARLLGDDHLHTARGIRKDKQPEESGVQISTSPPDFSY